MEVAPKFRVVPFQELERARTNWESVSLWLPPDLMAIIPHLLQKVADPDAALNSFQRLIERLGSELLPLLRRQPSLLHYTLTVFGHSLYLGETLLQNADLLQTVLRPEALDRSHTQEELRETFARFRSRSLDTNMASMLARFKRREYVRIMLRDTLGIASLAETTAEISALSDLLIDEALRSCETEMQRRYGSPQTRDSQGRLTPVTFAVLGLGKLGGNELNYSSDVDLLFLFGEGEADEGCAITNHEYFVRLSQQLTGILSSMTPEGFVFRIDLRLRPQGREGEAAISIEQAIAYYSEQARDWEHQALIKLRHCAGDLKLARRFIRGVQEHVYTEQLNFQAIETALAARERFTGTPRPGGTLTGEIDVKFDRGGIRDIEFLVQCLQRVYGGKEKWLRSGGTLFSLQKLHDKKHISGNDFHRLTTAYEFLRRVEHSLQLRRGQQTHRIPRGQHEIEVLARSLSRGSEEMWDAAELLDAIQQKTRSVTEIYNRLVQQQQVAREEGASAPTTPEVDFGRAPPDRQLLQRLSVDRAELYEVASRRDLEPHARRNLMKFLSSASTSEACFRGVERDALEKALELFRYSDFLTNILVRHPEDLSCLAELRSPSSRHQIASLSAAGDLIRGSHASGLEDYFASNALTHAEKLSLLRRRYRFRMLSSGARDVIESRPFSASFADTTVAAEEAISEAFSVAGRLQGLAVIALGRLGTVEFDCGSDADLLFVRAEEIDAGQATRASEELVQALSAYTSEGTVMAADLRLRPHGGEGELVVTPERLDKYLKQEAQPWEALTYTKMRYVCGSRAVAEKAIWAAQRSFERFATGKGFATDVREMRSKLEQADKGLKTDAGGMYDIDFMVGFLRIRHGVETATGSTLERLKKLGHAGLIPSADLQRLMEALEFYRTLEHSVRLVTGQSGKTLPVSENGVRSVSELVTRTSSRELKRDIKSTLAELQTAVREVFDRTVR